MSDPTPLVFFRFHYFTNFVFQLRNQKVFSFIVKAVLFAESTSKNPRGITLKNCNSILLFFIIFNVNVYKEKWFFQNRCKKSVKIGMLDSINFLERTWRLRLSIRDGWYLRLLIFFSLKCFIVEVQKMIHYLFVFHSGLRRTLWPTVNNSFVFFSLGGEVLALVRLWPLVKPVHTFINSLLLVLFRNWIARGWFLFWKLAFTGTLGDVILFSLGFKSPLGVLLDGRLSSYTWRIFEHWGWLHNSWLWSLKNWCLVLLGLEWPVKHWWHFAWRVWRQNFGLESALLFLFFEFPFVLGNMANITVFLLRYFVKLVMFFHFYLSVCACLIKIFFEKGAKIIFVIIISS